MKRLDIIFREKPLLILLTIGDKYNYASSIAKKIDCIYSHTVKTLLMMKEIDLVEFDKIGRIKEICLTDKGKELKDHLLISKNLMEGK